MRRSRTHAAAFTLIELMVVVALIAIILALAAPSFRDMIMMQRLRGINAQVVTDLAYARSEAVSRGTFVRVRFQQSGSMTCYIISTRLDSAESPQCDCTAASGSRCTDPSTTEVRTGQVLLADTILVETPVPGRTYYTIDPRTGGLILPPVDLFGIPDNEFPVNVHIDSARYFRDVVGLSGRVKVCAPSGSRVGGEACI